MLQTSFPWYSGLFTIIWSPHQQKNQIPMRDGKISWLRREPSKTARFGLWRIGKGVHPKNSSAWGRVLTSTNLKSQKKNCPIHTRWMAADLVRKPIWGSKPVGTPVAPREGWAEFPFTNALQGDSWSHPSPNGWLLWFTWYSRYTGFKNSDC